MIALWVLSFCDDVSKSFDDVSKSLSTVLCRGCSGTPIAPNHNTWTTHLLLFAQRTKTTIIFTSLLLTTHTSTLKIVYDLFTCIYIYITFKPILIIPIIPYKNLPNFKVHPSTVWEM